MPFLMGVTMPGGAFSTPTKVRWLGCRHEMVETVCESVRKVSVCAYGILKKRFRILKAGLPFKDPSGKTTKCDNTFMVCAMLHNQIIR